MTSQMHVTSLKHADVSHDVSKADQLHRGVYVAHSWQGKSLNKCQIRISSDILNHMCTFSLTWSSVSMLLRFKLRTPKE